MFYSVIAGYGLLQFFYQSPTDQLGFTLVLNMQPIKIKSGAGDVFPFICVYTWSGVRSAGKHGACPHETDGSIRNHIQVRRSLETE
jgi:hypothetical protein